MAFEMETFILQRFQESAENKIRFGQRSWSLVAKAAQRMTDALRSGHKILFFGNGGSAADAQHIAAELVNRFMADRKALPAIALTTDSSVLTSIGNDSSFEEIFARQVEALGQSGDVVFAISTSGHSPNVLRGVEAARARGLYSIGLTGGTGGKLQNLVDLCLCVSETNVTSRIQEVHITIGHIVCELIEMDLFGKFV